MNTPEKLFHTLLGLGDDWEITELEFDKDSGEVRLRIHELPCLLPQQRCHDDKGALLFAVWEPEYQRRTTLDIDLLVFTDNALDHLEHIAMEVCETEVEDERPLPLWT